MPPKKRSKSKRTPEFSSEPLKRGLFGKPTWIVFGAFVVAACCALTIPAIPQYHKLKKIEAELAEAQKEEKSLKKKAEELGAQAEALKKNPGYLEARARDPLRYHIAGETVIQLDR
ncbi:septum formation initiator family protein [Verrucomicrobiaceae bacterium 227]